MSGVMILVTILIAVTIAYMKIGRGVMVVRGWVIGVVMIRLWMIRHRVIRLRMIRLRMIRLVMMNWFMMIWVWLMIRVHMRLWVMEHRVVGRVRAGQGAEQGAGQGAEPMKVWAVSMNFPKKSEVRPG